MRMAVKQKASKRATTALKTTVRKQKAITLKSPSLPLWNSLWILWAFLCVWDIYHEMCLMLLARFIQGLFYMWSPDPRGEKLHERRLSSVSRSGSNNTQIREDIGNHFLFPFWRGKLKGGLVFFYCCKVVKIRIKNFHVGLIFVWVQFHRISLVVPSWLCSICAPRISEPEL